MTSHGMDQGGLDYTLLDAPDNKYRSMRNCYTVQSAVIRGDRKCSIFNQAGLNRDEFNRIRFVSGPADKRHFWEQGVVKWKDKYSSGREEATPSHNTVRSDVPFAVVQNWFGFQLRFVKVLGIGGFGAATLWEVEFEDRSSMLVVIKMPRVIEKNTRSGFNAQHEGKWHDRYDGAAHTVQSIDLDAIASRKRNRVLFDNHFNITLLRFRSGHPLQARSRNMLVLEYACWGDLYGLVGKAYHENKVFLNRNFWQIWECLVRGVVAVAYQKGKPELEARLKAWEQDAHWQRYIDQLRVYLNSHDVHFDLEEQNILVSGDEEESHRHCPIFKLHDFGSFSKDMRRAWRKDAEYKYWASRDIPKIYRPTPEQTHKDWEDFDLPEIKADGIQKFIGDNFDTGERVAGRYGTWTNIFLIAKIMESIITGDRHAHPFAAEKWTPVSGEEHERLTYGWRVVKPGYRGTCDLELREEIARCQSEAPADRPVPAHLLARCVRRRKEGFAQSEEEAAQFWKELVEPTASIATKHQNAENSGSWHPPPPPPGGHSSFQPPRARGGRHGGEASEGRRGAGGAGGAGGARGGGAGGGRGPANPPQGRTARQGSSSRRQRKHQYRTREASSGSSKDAPSSRLARHNAPREKRQQEPEDVVMKSPVPHNTLAARELDTFMGRVLNAEVFRTPADSFANTPFDNGGLPVIDEAYQEPVGWESPHDAERRTERDPAVRERLRRVQASRPGEYRLEHHGDGDPLRTRDEVPRVRHRSMATVIHETGSRVVAESKRLAKLCALNRPMHNIAERIDTLAEVHERFPLS